MKHNTRFKAILIAATLILLVCAASDARAPPGGGGGGASPPYIYIQSVTTTSTSVTFTVSVVWHCTPYISRYVQVKCWPEGGSANWISLNPVGGVYQ